jgi:hypothetical protein
METVRSQWHLPHSCIVIIWLLQEFHFFQLDLYWWITIRCVNVKNRDLSQDCECICSSTAMGTLPPQYTLCTFKETEARGSLNGKMKTAQIILKWIILAYKDQEQQQDRYKGGQVADKWTPWQMCFLHKTAVAFVQSCGSGYCSSCYKALNMRSLSS